MQTTGFGQRRSLIGAVGTFVCVVFVLFAAAWIHLLQTGSNESVFCQLCRWWSAKHGSVRCRHLHMIFKGVLKSITKVRIMYVFWILWNSIVNQWQRGDILEVNPFHCWHHAFRLWRLLKVTSVLLLFLQDFQTSCWDRNLLLSRKSESVFSKHKPKRDVWKTTYFLGHFQILYSCLFLFGNRQKTEKWIFCHILNILFSEEEIKMLK